MEAILSLPEHIQLSNGDVLPLHDYVIQLVTGAASYLGVYGPAQCRELRTYLHELFFFIDLPSSIKGLRRLIEPQGANEVRMRERYCASMLKEQFEPESYHYGHWWTMEWHLFAREISREELALLFETECGLRPQLW